jgi:hypothetical protein
VGVRRVRDGACSAEYSHAGPGQAEFSEWSLPENLGAPINTPGTEVGPHISKNGLSFFHLRNFDVFVSQRANVEDAWGARQSVGTNINTTFNEASPSLSLDERLLLFASDRPGGFGGFDLYVSRRHNRRDDLGWQLPVNLGDGVNTPANELQASVFEDDATGVITMYFASNRPDGLGGDDSTPASFSLTRRLVRRCWLGS